MEGHLHMGSVSQQKKGASSIARERITRSIANTHSLNSKALPENVWGSLAPLIVVKVDAPLSWLDEAGAVTDDTTGSLASWCSR